MSKKDYYLYVYEGQGADTVLLARYDCAFSQKKGNKQQRGDMKTPHCTMLHPFKITEIKDASAWVHDFGDGRGAIKSYGNYFLRLLTDTHKGIGIHGSTNNEESVPGRASEGCIRLKDEDIHRPEKELCVRKHEGCHKSRGQRRPAFRDPRIQKTEHSEKAPPQPKQHSEQRADTESSDRIQGHKVNNICST